MRKWKIAAFGAALIASLMAISPIAQSQLIYGNTFAFWNVTGPLTAGTLSVSGASTLAGTSAHTGAATFASTVDVTGAVTAASTLAVTGAVTAPSVAISGITTASRAVVSGSGLTIVTAVSPTATLACVAGTISWDTSYLYLCSASGAWKRVAMTGGY